MTGTTDVDELVSTSWTRAEGFRHAESGEPAMDTSADVHPDEILADAWSNGGVSHHVQRVNLRLSSGETCAKEEKSRLEEHHEE